MVKAILLKPLDGKPEGTEAEFSQADFDKLKRQNAVREAGSAKKAAAPENKMEAAPANKATRAKARKA